jgi:hypothetical protein
MRPLSSRLAAAAVVIAALVPAACGDDSEEEPTTQPNATPYGEPRQANPDEATDDDEAAAQAVRAYYGALAEKDGKKACEHLTSGAQAQLERIFDADACESTIEKYIGALPAAELERARDVKVRSSETRGLSGTVRVEGTSRSIPLLKERGEWKIAGFNTRPQPPPD